MRLTASVYGCFEVPREPHIKVGKLVFIEAKPH